MENTIPEQEIKKARVISSILFAFGFIIMAIFLDFFTDAAIRTVRYMLMWVSCCVGWYILSPVIMKDKAGKLTLRARRFLVTTGSIAIVVGFFRILALLDRYRKYKAVMGSDFTPGYTPLSLVVDGVAVLFLFTGLMYLLHKRKVQ